MHILLIAIGLLMTDMALAEAMSNKQIHSLFEPQISALDDRVTHQL